MEPNSLVSLSTDADHCTRAFKIFKVRSEEVSAFAVWTGGVFDKTIVAKLSTVLDRREPNVLRVLGVGSGLYSQSQ